MAISFHDTHPLSHSQRRLWFIYKIAPANNAYLVVQGIHIKGHLNLEAVSHATEMVIARHGQLRANFIEIDNEPRQIIGAPYPANVVLIDVSATFSGEPENVWDAIGHDFYRKPFDLTHDRMLRTAVVKLADDQYLLCFVLHHIVADGWSLQVLKSDFAAYYNAHNNAPATGIPPVMPPVGAEYTDYVEQSNAALQGEAFQDRLTRRARDLAGAPPFIDLPVDRPYPETLTFEGSLEIAALPAETVDGVNRACRELGITPSMFCLAAYGVLLKKISGQNDILVAVPFAAREKAEYQNAFGYFVNTVVIRLDLRDDPTIRQLAGRIKGEVVQAIANQDIPLDMLVGEIRPERVENRNPLVQTMFSFLSGIKMVPDIHGAETSLLLPPRTASIFDLTMDVVGLDGVMKVTLEYNTNIFSNDAIRRFLERYFDILSRMAAGYDLCVSEIPNLGAEEEALLCAAWLSGKDLAPPDRSVHELISEQCRRSPEKEFLCFGERRMTGLELENRVNAIAVFLRARGLLQGGRVGILLPQGFDMVVAALAVLKAGGVFVPLDFKAPVQRIATIHEEAGAWGIITSRQFLPHFEDIPVFTIEDIPPADSVDPPVAPSLKDPAYIIFTSGTTGTPKGVVVSHHAFAAHCQAAVDACAISGEDRYLQFSPFYFDAALEQIFPALTRGAVVVLKEEGLWAAADFDERITRYGVSVADLPPLYLQELLLYYQHSGTRPPESLRAVVVGGEALPVEVARRWQKSAFGRIPLFNAYGPTEAVVTATWKVITPETPLHGASGYVSIGGPMPGRVLRIVDDQLRQVDVGIHGELCIGGIIADGYLNQPELTGERFITTEDGLRLYRSGDRVRLLSDGSIEFCGRIDEQVKIRGFRIEPGEIEAAMRKLDSVADVHVRAVPAPAGGDILAAYIVAGREIAESAISAHLREYLPDHMIPSHYVFLPELPLTPAGKIDQRALPQPRFDEADEAGFTEQERIIAEIWREVLGVEQVSPHRNFFESGGHSLMLVRLHTLLTSRLDTDIRLVELFRHTTVAKQALRIFANKNDELPDAPRQGAPHGDIAIIGMSCRFPAADDAGQFWENLISGRHCISFYTREELAQNGVPIDLVNHPNYVGAHGALEDIDCFDARFFGIPPTEAKQIDPQHRLFMQEAWHALEHGGYDPFRYPGRIGVFAGCGMCFYLMENILPDGDLAHGSEGYQISMATDKDFLPLRISYKFNLRGPSVNVNTACSTSLVAAHLACKSLLAGECDMALAGGATVALNQKSGYLHQQGGIMSPDGYCRAFADDAAGIVGGSGTGAVLLKRLADAVRDGDTIHAVIKGSAINNDGNAKVGFTAPSIAGQAAVIREACRAGNIDPETVAYVEAHGTGTELGDPVEIEALSEVFPKGADRKGSCAIGAVKSNIGHLDTAAGVAGLIKAALVVKHGQIPPSLHCDTPNRKIGFAGTPFYVNTTLSPWPHGGTRRAGVSSFGMGGTNAHMVVEQPPEEPPRDGGDAGLVIPLSAETPESLRELRRRFADFLGKRPEMPAEDIFFTLATGRRECALRTVILAPARADAIRLLMAADNENPAPGMRLSAGEASAWEDGHPGANPQGLTHNHLGLLARWVNGGVIDWRLFFQEGVFRRRPLPLYPFERKRHWIAKKHPVAPAATEDAIPPAAARKPITDWFYAPSWQSAPRANRPAGKRSFLALHSGGEAERAIVDLLSGEDIASFEIGAATDMGRLFSELGEGNGNILEILYLPPLNAMGMEDAFTFFFHHLVEIVQAAIATQGNREIALTVLARNTVEVMADDVIDPAKSLLFGPLRVIPLEYPMIRCRLIDVDASGNARLGGEIMGDGGPPLVALRQRRRWVRTLTPMPLTEEHSGGGRLKAGGVYLITGGTSGIGYAIAEYLAEHWQARLALFSRHRIEQNDERLRGLEKAGAAALAIACDVTDAEAVGKAVERVKEAYGRIDGVIHSVGAFGGGLIPLLNRREAEEVMAAKVSGSLHLFAAVRGADPDFLFFCSSLTGMIGAQGQAAYTSANAFEDALAEHIRTSAGLFAVSAAWDGWAYTGMAARALDGVDVARRTARSLRFTPRDYWPMGEHRIDNRPVMVGAAYLDFAAMGLNPEGDRCLRLEDVRLLAPLAASLNEEIVLDLDAVREKGRPGTFSINSRISGTSTEHARGSFFLGPQARPARRDIAGLLAKFHEETEARQPGGAGVSLSVGARWDIPHSVRVQGNEVFARFALRNAGAADLLDTPLHPALLDRATACTLLPAADASGYLPVRFGKVTVHAPLASEIYCLGALHPQEAPSAPLQADIVIMDSRGEILIEIENYTLVKTKGRPVEQTPRPFSLRADIPVANAILPHEGKQAFAMILGQEEPVVAISTIDIAAQHRGVPRAARLEAPPLEAGIDEIVRGVFVGLLGEEALGQDDDLFAVGADSLTMLQAASRLQEQLGVDIPIDGFFAHPTIASLARHIVETFEFTPGGAAIEWEEEEI